MTGRMTWPVRRGGTPKQSIFNLAKSPNQTKAPGSHHGPGAFAVQQRNQSQGGNMFNDGIKRGAGRWPAAIGRVFLGLALMGGCGAGLAEAAALQPVISGVTPTMETTPTWAWASGGDGAGIYRYKLDAFISTGGATVTSETSFTPVEPLSEGKHILYVQEKGVDGKWSKASSKGIVVDTTPPAKPPLRGLTPTTNTTPAWNWNTTYRYKLDDPDLETGATETTDTEFTPAAPLATGTHILYLQRRDLAGNWSASRQFAIEIQAPTESLSTLPDTGQTASYTETFGEDSDYTINPPSYTVNGDGTVTDNVTGLMWQQEDDNATRPWFNALTYCENLDLGLNTDWRLPTRKELMRLVNYGVYNPAIDPAAFPNTDSSVYWSSTTLASDTGSAWFVYFYDGLVYDDNKGNSYSARCVRGGQ
jgi:hypothetical protein